MTSSTSRSSSVEGRGSALWVLEILPYDGYYYFQDRSDSDSAEDSEADESEVVEIDEEDSDSDEYEAAGSGEDESDEDDGDADHPEAASRNEQSSVAGGESSGEADNTTACRPCSRVAKALRDCVESDSVERVGSLSDFQRGRETCHTCGRVVDVFTKMFQDQGDASKQLRKFNPMFVHRSEGEFVFGSADGGGGDGWFLRVGKKGRSVCYNLCFGLSWHR